MNIQRQIDYWKLETAYEAKRRRNRLKVFKAAAETLERIPDDFSFSMVYKGKVELSAVTSNGTEAKILAAEVRRILGVPESTKELNPSMGTMKYITENDQIRTAVSGGDIPENCKLVPKSNSYITYEMVCEGGSDAELLPV